MSNTYTPDGQFIIDATCQRWAVNAWHTAAAAVGVLMIKAQEIIYESVNKGEER